MAKIIARPGTILILILSVMITGCFDSAEVKLVKEGRLKRCPNYTVEEIAEGYLQNPEWFSGISEKGVKFVNLSGGVADDRNGQEFQVVFQFTIDEENQHFEFSAIESDGYPRDKFVARFLFGLMCANAMSDDTDSSDSQVDKARTSTSFFGRMVKKAVKRSEAIKRSFRSFGSGDSDLPVDDKESGLGLMDRVRGIADWISELFSRNEGAESSTQKTEGNLVAPESGAIGNENPDADAVNNSVINSPESEEVAAESRSPRFCSSGSNVLFSCMTEKGKLIELCDAGNQIEYAFGRPNQEAEMLLKKDRELATTEQWSGVGSMYYSVDVPNGNTTYRVYWGAPRDPESTPEAGVEVEIDSKRAAIVPCGEGEIYNNMEGVNLNPASR